MAALTQKLLTFQFTLASGNFQSSTGGSGNSITLSGLRCEAKILKSGGAGLSSLEGAIYGMTLSQMNQLNQIPGPTS
ncbi:MAG: hypothetical protein WA648_02915 [Methylocella sp.]